MEDWLKLLVFFGFSLLGCTYCYLSGKQRTWSLARKRLSEAYQKGYTQGLSDGFHSQESKAIIDMLRNNVAKKVEEKIRAEYQIARHAEVTSADETNQT
jgi:hypothetical protein